MKLEIISTDYQRLKTRTDQIIGDIHQLTILTGHEEMIRLITELRNRLADPFMFVIVGEVKAGKSSFINALLDAKEEICAVAPSPMTDTIQQIVYGDQKGEEVLSPFLKRVFQPIEILKNIAIVDTPGTNTIIEHHQEITEKFIPAADLIVFVFEAKNPYRQSAWDFFHLIHDEWKKKIIFVLQQKDLMEENDLNINLSGVTEYAVKNGVNDPLVFAVSAKLEQEGSVADSGYHPLKVYINKNITGGRAPFLKLESSLNTGQTFLTRIGAALNIREKQLRLDLQFRDEIHKILNEQASRSHRQVEILLENLVNNYNKIWADQREELSSGLSFVSLLKRSFRALFNKNENIKKWLAELALRIETTMKERLFLKLSHDVDDLAEAVQNMVKFIDLKIQNTKSFFQNDTDLFRDISEKRSTILKDLRDTFGQYVENQSNFKNERLFPSAKDMVPSMATGSGLAVIGIVLTAVTNGAVMDFTGGIVTTIGLLFAGITTGLNKRKVLREFDAEMKKGNNKLNNELGHNLKQYINDIQSNIQSHFVKLDDYLSTEKDHIQIAKDELAILNSKASELLIDLEGRLAE